MPRIELIDPVYYNPDDPYHYYYDNLPLRNIIQRQVLINLAVDNVIAQMTDAVGTQNTVANRLNQSINADGSLKTSAVDATLHTMDNHTDTNDYVRMTKDQSDKLNFISDGATNLSFIIHNDDLAGSLVTFDSGTIEFEASKSITFHVTPPNKVQAHSAFPIAATHVHYYDQTPVDDNVLTQDHIHYRVNSVASPFINGSLRVFVNGVRLSASTEVYVPGYHAADDWTLLSFTPDATNGRFYFSTAVGLDDKVRIDYDTSFI